jgi:protein-tyrosine phosphatase
MSTWSDGTPGLVVLPDGRRIRGRGLRHPEPSPDLPEFGLYLTGERHTENRWESRWVLWPDYRLPRSPDDLIDALQDVNRRATTQRVEISCTGGVGRTGTAIALLTRLAGVPAAEAVAWTRGHYHRHAVETPWQRRFAARLELPD